MRLVSLLLLFTIAPAVQAQTASGCDDLIGQWRTGYVIEEHATSVMLEFEFRNGGVFDATALMGGADGDYTTGVAGDWNCDNGVVTIVYNPESCHEATVYYEIAELNTSYFAFRIIYPGMPIDQEPMHLEAVRIEERELDAPCC